MLVRATFDEKVDELQENVASVRKAATQVVIPPPPPTSLCNHDDARTTHASAPHDPPGPPSHPPSSHPCSRWSILPSSHPPAPRPPSSHPVATPPQVKSSRALKEVLKIALALGNYLNGTSNKGR